MHQDECRLEEILNNPATFMRKIFFNELRTISRQTVEHANIPVESKEFLCDVGLPAQDPILINRFNILSFDLESCFGPLGELAQRNNLSVPRIYDQHLCLALNVRYEYAVCIDSLADGRVLFLSLGDACVETFVNSRVEKLGPFLAIFVGYCKNAFQLPADKEPAELESYMLRIDSAALQSPSFWSALMEEIISDVY